MLDDRGRSRLDVHVERKRRRLDASSCRHGYEQKRIGGSSLGCFWRHRPHAGTRSGAHADADTNTNTHDDNFDSDDGSRSGSDADALEPDGFVDLGSPVFAGECVQYADSGRGARSAGQRADAHAVGAARIERMEQLLAWTAE
jgi:hypothetical protein